MRDEVWKIGKRVLMCFLSRSLDVVCLEKACLSIANGFPQSLQEPFLKTPVQRGTVTVRVHDKEGAHSHETTSELSSIPQGEVNSITN